MMMSVMSDAEAARWVHHAIGCLYKGNVHDGDIDVQYAELLDFIQSAPPPPASLHAMWEQRVWKLQNEPDALYCLRCLSSVCGRGSASFLLDVRSFLLLSCVSPVDDVSIGDSGLQQHVIRVVALRVLPCTTDVIQLGWSLVSKRPGTNNDHSPLLRPTYCSRTHVVVQFASGRHFSAWAYGNVGLRLRIGAMVRALVYPSRTEDQELAFVFHNVADLTAADDSVGFFSLPHLPGGGITTSLFLIPCSLSFKELVGSFAPEIAGQTLCKSLLLLVVVHTMYRAVRCRTRRPLHLLLLGASRSGKSALLRVFLRLLGSRATLVGAHVVHGQQRSVAMSQAIAATYPRVDKQLLFGGAVSTVDAFVVDEISTRGCADLVEGLMTGVCPINGTVSASTLRGLTVSTQVQLTAAANDDLLAVAAVMQQFSLVARTTAQLSFRSTASIGEGVIAASVARSQSSSKTPSRSVSLCEPSPRRSETTSHVGPLTEAFLLTVVEEASSPSTLESMIPGEAFAHFYRLRLREYLCSGNISASSLAPLLAVLWELNLTRLILERWCHSGDNSTVWSEALGEEVWECYKHHLWTVDTAAAAAGDRTTRQMGVSDNDLLSIKGGARRKVSKKAVCMALLRMMLREQREGGSNVVSEETARVLFQQLGGEELTRQSFHTVIQHLLDAAFIIRKLNAYAVIGDA